MNSPPYCPVSHRLGLISEIRYSSKLQKYHCFTKIERQNHRCQQMISKYEKVMLVPNNAVTIIIYSNGTM